MTLLLRPSVAADVPAIAAIYAHHVHHGTASFELEAPDEAEVARRRAEVLSLGLPWLVAKSGGQVAGYAYANLFRSRPAYRFTLEDSIYIAESHRGQGIGRLLLAELLARCTAAGARQMLAVIGGAEPASIALHRWAGFELCGTLQHVGWKFDRWRDVTLMQRELGHGSRSAAEE
jgi:L-amino acid N-acyltransferase YncA